MMTEVSGYLVEVDGREDVVEDERRDEMRRVPRTGAEIQQQSWYYRIHIKPEPER